MVKQRLLLACPDQPGLVALVTNLLAQAGADIHELDEHAEAGKFAMRIVYSCAASEQDKISLLMHQTSNADWQLRIHAADHKPRVAILCSQEDHCLADLLWRFKAGELSGKPVGIWSTQPLHHHLADAYAVPLHHTPVGDGGMPVHERTLLNQLDGQVDLIILARYMRILSENFLQEADVPVINIHHSFLPAFIGANPYQEAHERGVKLIGATAHYAIPELDAGPIIEQDVVRVAHRQTPEQLRELGRDVERVVLARAVRAHLEDRVVVWDNRTVVFG